MPRSSAVRRTVATVEELIIALGGIDAVGAFWGITPNAVYNWIAQDAIPKRYHADMLMLTEKAGLYWRPPGWDPQVQLRYRPAPVEAA